MTNSVRSFLDSRLAFRLVQVGVIISILIGLNVTYTQYELTRCLADYNNQAAIVNSARTETAAKDRTAVDNMVQSFVDARNAPSVEVARKQANGALDNYLKARAANDAERARSPLVPPPSTKCG